MIDLGDLREGIFYQDEDRIFAAAEECLKLKNIKLYGIGVNLTCYGAVIPKYDNLSVLVEIAGKMKKDSESVWIWFPAAIPVRLSCRKKRAS